MESVELKYGDAVQFNENHKWCGCIGIVDEVGYSKIMVGVPVPFQGTAYVYCTADDLYYVGKAVLIKEGE